MENTTTFKEALDIAISLHKNKELEKSKEIYLNILNQIPQNSIQYAQTLHLLGLVYADKGDIDKAINNISQAIKIYDKDPIYFHNLAMIFDKIGNEKESINNFFKAIEISSNYHNSHLAYYNIAIYYHNNNQFEKALSYFNMAIKIKNDFHDAIFNKSLIQLKKGDYIEGFKNFHSRFYKLNPTDNRNLSKPSLFDENNTNLKGKKILVLHEQGFGDNIQFIRYLSLLKSKGAYVILETKKQLINLFNNLKSIDKIIQKENHEYKNTDYDFYIYIMDLPIYFKTDINSIPLSFPYIKTDKIIDNKFKEIISKQSKDKINIGIAWKGNPNQNNDKKRSISFENFSKLLDIPNISVFSLQKDNDIDLSNFHIIDLKEELVDFNHTASIINNLDIIITVDTSIAHLSGALNKKTFLILSQNADWRWLENIDFSPWYKSIKILRKKNEDENYDRIFKDIKNEINNYLVNINL